VLGTPPAFVLSQDQTLQFDFLDSLNGHPCWLQPGAQLILHCDSKKLRYPQSLIRLAIQFSKSSRLSAGSRTIEERGFFVKLSCKTTRNYTAFSPAG
jgi:hypothetical protein